ncbi:C40 family peptidase [Alkalitalea saponilacus]|uniref:NlpC/P60 family protein n=1 Tax=Alkalitalea saponilacus TaxID=889453 RepID=A0A1T5HTY0_9BACT|nr:C40 family peptidase [Alkalitalea saponilacus]SKC24153.1 NlpC/P60 family protein [Alkalitalea saponilacus]
MKFVMISLKYLFLVTLFLHCGLTSCSRQAYGSHTYSNINTSRERSQLDVFLDGGVEKPLRTSHTNANAIINSTRQYLGVPHCMGGKTSRCMDCSGLLVAVFAAHNIQLPHNSQEQARYGKIISNMNDLKRGDLVFFIRSYRTSNFITHSGIYLGNGEFIHTSSSNGVVITPMSNPWWNEKFIFGTRIF